MFNNRKKFAETLDEADVWFALFVLGVLIAAIGLIADLSWGAFFPSSYVKYAHTVHGRVFEVIVFFAGAMVAVALFKMLRDFVRHRKYLRNHKTREKTAENVNENRVKSAVKQIVNEYQSDMEKIQQKEIQSQQAIQKPPKTGDKPILQDDLRKELGDVLKQGITGKMSAKETAEKITELMKKYRQLDSDIKKQIDALNSGHEM